MYKTVTTRCAKLCQGSDLGLWRGLAWEEGIMAHVMKLKLGQVAPLHRHSTREMEATRERDNIDAELTHCNYTIGQPFAGGWQANIQDCIEMHNSNGRNIRSDAVVAASWVITQPQELPDDYRRDFFAACHEFL